MTSKSAEFNFGLKPMYREQYTINNDNEEEITATIALKNVREQDLKSRSGMKAMQFDQNLSILHLASYVWLAVSLLFVDHYKIFSKMATRAPHVLDTKNGMYALQIVGISWYSLYVLHSLSPFVHRRRTHYRKLTISQILANLILAGFAMYALSAYQHPTAIIPDSFYKACVIGFSIAFLLISYSTFFGSRFYRLDAPFSHMFIEDVAVSLYQGCLLYGLIWICFSESVLNYLDEQNKNGLPVNVFLWTVQGIIFLYLIPCIIFLGHFVQGLVFYLFLLSSADKLLTPEKCYNGFYEVPYIDSRYVAFVFISYAFIIMGVSMIKFGYFLHWVSHKRSTLRRAFLNVGDADAEEDEQEGQRFLSESKHYEDDI